jgi:hypothetical protein
MANPEISLAISATSFGLVIGFVAGYATLGRRDAMADDPPHTSEKITSADRQSTVLG